MKKQFLSVLAFSAILLSSCGGTLPARFTTKDYAKCAHIPQKYATTGLNVLLETKTVVRVGKMGNAYLYEKAAESEK